MKGKIFLTAIITFILTTLFWFAIGLAINRANNPIEGEDVESIDYSKAIEGKWEPVELAEKKLEFNYGVLKETETYGTFDHSDTRPYRLDGNYLQFFWKGNTLEGEINIYDQDGKTYLEISDLSGYAGRYVKVEE